VNKLIESLRYVSLFGISKWAVKIMAEAERQQNREESEFLQELKSLLDGFVEYFSNKYQGAPMTRVQESAHSEGVATPRELIRNIESCIFLRYTNDKEVIKKYPLVKEIVDCLNGFSLSQEVEDLADNIRVSSRDAKSVSTANFSFRGSKTLFLRLRGNPVIRDLVKIEIGRTIGMVEFLRALTGWEEQYSRDRLSDLLRFYAKRIKNNWRGPLPWMIQNLYQEIRSKGIQKTKAACFVYNVFEPVIPEFISWKVFSKRHPEVTHYNFRQYQLRELHKYARVKELST
jgi:hypothetical protein